MQLARKSIIILTITTFVAGGFLISPAHAQELIPLDDYLSYFYNRYSAHLDQWGLVYKAPGYGVQDFQSAKSAREILSLALYYKYRALAGDLKALRILRVAILNADYELHTRSMYHHSFSDAWAQLAMLTLIDNFPDLLSSDEQDKIHSEIAERAEPGILAADSSNRAALSAVYWQYIVNNLFAKELITSDEKKHYDQLIYQKITSIIGADVTSDGWYREGSSMSFNPHYHMVTATAFLSYADLTHDIQTYLLAKKMTDNLRAVTFPNGMVEARLGHRPVGLGAQFYLGAALLSYRFGYDDFATYLNYANGHKFFSDPDYPNRLEYHSTIKDTYSNYHDDISFSNLSELALLTPSLSSLEFSYTESMDNRQVVLSQDNIQLSAHGDQIEFNGLKFSQAPDGNSTSLSYPSLSGVKVKGAVSVNLAETYSQPRLSSTQESALIQEFYLGLVTYFAPKAITASDTTLNILASAYVYGGYSLEEVIDTVQFGPRAIHPTIPAVVWRLTPNYQGYLAQYSADGL